MDDGKVDSFDKFGFLDQNLRIDKGWLTSQTIIQLKFHSNPLFFWKEKLKNRKTLVKVTPIDLTKKNNTDPLLTYESMDNNSLSLDTLDIGSASYDVWPITEICVSIKCVNLLSFFFLCEVLLIDLYILLLLYFYYSFRFINDFGTLFFVPGV